MNSYGKTGYQNSNEMKPKFEFNASGSSKLGGEKANFSSLSGISRPRLVKIRRSMNSKSMGSSETGKIDPGFNPFRPVSDNVPGVSSRLDSDASDGLVNKVGGVSVAVDGVSRSRYVKNLKGTNKVEKVGNELIDEIRKLRIESESMGGRSGINLNDSVSGSFSKIELPSGGVGDELSSKLPEELERLNLGGVVSGGLSKSGFTSDSCGGGPSFSGSFCNSVAAEVPIDFNRLNLKDSSEIGGRSFVFSTPSKKDFVFGKNGTNTDVTDPSVNSNLPDNRRNLKLYDADGKNGFPKEVNINMGDHAFVSGVSQTASGSSGVDSMVLDEMEKLNIGGNSDESRDHTNPNRSSSPRRPPEGGMGDKDCIKLNPRETVSLVGEKDKHPSAPQLPEYGKSSVPSREFGSSTSSFPSAGFNFHPMRSEYQAHCSDGTEKKEGFSFTGRQDGPQTPSIEFRTPGPKGNLFTGSNLNLGFKSRKGSAKVAHLKGRKGKVNEPNPVLVSIVKNFTTNEKNIQHEASDSYSPMDVSPHGENVDDAQSAGQPSLGSDNPASIGVLATESDCAGENDLITATEKMDINEGYDLKPGEGKVQPSKCTYDTGLNRASTLADCVSTSKCESFITATENLDTDGESEAESKYDPSQSDYLSASSSISSGGSSFTFAASSSFQTPALTGMWHHTKKNRMKTAPEVTIPPLTASLSDATPERQFTASSRDSVLPSQVNQKDIFSTATLKGCSNLNVASLTSRTLGGDNLEGTKRGILPPKTAASQVQEACDKWRLRGNQAYANGDLQKADYCYTQGLSCIPPHETSRDCLRFMVLCYSNRAATRMSLGRMREALQDCLVAAEVDHSFFRVQLRAANCYLALGEIDDALLYFKKLLQSTDVCVERKIIVEASEGLQKAQKVSECVNRSAEFLLQETSTGAELALEVLSEALAISPYSEQLLERKVEALLMLQKYEEVIQLCEQSLESAEKNSSIVAADEGSSNSDVSVLLKQFSFRIWRYKFVFQSNFYLGKLEEGLDLLEKQENWKYMMATYGNETFESLIPHLSTARELIRLKSAGNVAFQAGRHTEAVDHYSSALSFNVESRPFTAVCFGNRAAAYQALGQITDAIADCSWAIVLDRNYLKAISRRATLFEMIRDYDQAAKDLQSLVYVLTKQVEEKANIVGASLSSSSVADLRQARQRLYQMEEQARKEIPLNFYLILGVEPSVKATDLKKAYRKAALRHHPDKAGQYLARGESGDDVLWKEIAEKVYKDADRLFKMVGEAYAILSDPTKRSQYDIEEEARNDQKKSSSSTSRMPTDTSSYPAGRGSVGQTWRQGWRSSATPYSRGFEPSTNRNSRGFEPSADPCSRGFEPSRSGRYY